MIPPVQQGLSSRHHYIPQFLIKNFADSSNLLWVYDKDKKEIIRQQRSPKSIFFEWERNLFQVNGEVIDNIEKMYADVDDLLSRTLNKVLTTDTMNGRELTLLIFLVGLTKWRIPHADDTFKDLVKDIALRDLGLNLRPVDPNATVDPQSIKNIEKMDFVKEAKRLLMAIRPLSKPGNLDEIHSNCFIVAESTYPALLGDNPLIEAPNGGFDTLSDFVFPFGTRHTLICKRGAEKGIASKAFYLQKDLTIFHQAKKFVACSDKKQLENIVAIYEKLVAENKTHLLHKYIFEYIV